MMIRHYGHVFSSMDKVSVVRHYRHNASQETRLAGTCSCDRWKCPLLLSRMRTAPREGDSSHYKSEHKYRYISWRPHTYRTCCHAYTSGMHSASPQKYSVGEPNTPKIKEAKHDTYILRIGTLKSSLTQTGTTFWDLYMERQYWLWVRTCHRGID